MRVLPIAMLTAVLCLATSGCNRDSDTTGADFAGGGSGVDEEAVRNERHAVHQRAPCSRLGVRIVPVSMSEMDAFRLLIALSEDPNEPTTVPEPQNGRILSMAEIMAQETEEMKMENIGSTDYFDDLDDVISMFTFVYLNLENVDEFNFTSIDDMSDRHPTAVRELSSHAESPREFAMLDLERCELGEFSLALLRVNAMTHQTTSAINDIASAIAGQSDGADRRTKVLRLRRSVVSFQDVNERLVDEIDAFSATDSQSDAVTQFLKNDVPVALHAASQHCDDAIGHLRNLDADADEQLREAFARIGACVVETSETVREMATRVSMH